ncbi:hypothetical protein ACLBO7_30435, partial [Klebsiella pneumoniae]
IGNRAIEGDLKKEEIKFTPSEYMVSSSGFIANNPKTIADFMTVFSTQYVSALRKYGELGVRYLKADKPIDNDQETSDARAIAG